jgi:hypothetical protein
VVVYLEVVGRDRLVWDLWFGVEEVGYVMVVEVTASEEGTRAKDEMVPTGVGLGRAAAWKGSCWRAIAMDVPESRAGQGLEPAVEETGSTKTREDVPAQEAAQA